MSYTSFALWLLAIAGQVTAQTVSSLHASLSVDSNPDGLVSTGNMRPTADGGYLIAGTMGKNEFARAVPIDLGSGGNLTVGLSALFAGNEGNCSNEVLDAGEQTTAFQDNAVQCAPTLNNRHFQVLTQGGEWVGAEYSVVNKNAQVLL